MNKKLCGTTLIYNGIKQDYCYIECIKCLQALCDFVIVVECGSDDGTAESLDSIKNDKTEIIYRTKDEWDSVKGKTKLAYFTNIAIDRAHELGYEWQINLQADEIISERDFPIIREAINKEGIDAYWNTRINLWGDSQHYLDVPENRKPVGTEIIRLTQTKYHSIDDAQSVDAQHGSWEYINTIRIWHMGFVRNKFLHTEKIRHMLEEVFLMGNDQRVKDMDGIFDPFVMFSKEDIKPIEEPLPIFVQEWADLRDKINML